MRRGLAIAVALLGVAILCGLGFWQLDRRAWKHDLIAEIDAGLAAPPSRLTRLPDLGAAWRPVSVEGAWAKAAPIRIGPKSRNGKVGADYAAAFAMDFGGAIVVRLGWAPDSAGVAAIDLPDGAVTLTGILVAPPRPNLFTPENRPPDQWLWLDPPAIAESAGFKAGETAPLALNLREPPTGLVAIPARPALADDHLHYALTWFALAAALAVVAVLLLRRRRPPSGQP